MQTNPIGGAATTYYSGVQLMLASCMGPDGWADLAPF